MYNDSDLDLFQKILKNFHLPITILKENSAPIPETTLGLYSLFKPHLDFSQIFWEHADQYKSSKIYRLNNDYQYRYLMFYLPNAE